MELKQRKNLRLQSFDYSSAKYYFVTICTKKSRPSVWADWRERS